MGFSVGGEYTGVVAYLLEGARPERRGLIASLASAASEVGALLAVGISALTVASHERCAARRAGAGASPSCSVRRSPAAVWIARSTMHESPEFHRQRERGHRSRAARCATPCAPSRGDRPRFRDLGAGVDHLLCRHHLRPGFPDLGRYAERRARRCGCRPPPRSW